MWIAGATAIAQITIPNTFVNGTVADATQVNANFNAVGAGALNRTGGTMTGTLTTQNIAAAADATYDVGASGVKFRDAYFSRNVTIGGNATVTGTLTASLAASSLTGQVAVANGGTALSSTPTNGQLLVGNGTNYTLAALTAGSGISVTNGAGSITLAATGVALVLDKSTTEQDVSNTTTETSVYSFSVPGGTLGTTGTLRLTVSGLMHTDSSTDTLTLKVKYGGIIFAQWSQSLTATTNGAFLFVTHINANGSTGSQRATSVMQRVAAGTTQSLAVLSNGMVVDTGYRDDGAVDSTASQTLTVTAQWSSALSTDHLKRWAAITEKL